ncbi:MAG: rhodanese-like domain-containing protein [Spirirestis rafaelensis WJT71-NPBG6]|jgi:rhodanese-related sulfurtransferase|nr:rhodanese-like domain-containing protein [Spirirestis rafaelensis WJT71-NPBG6]
MESENKAVETAKNAADSAKNTAESAAKNVADAANNAGQNAKNALNNVVGDVIPSQPPVDPQSDVHVLKSRLEWGEPAFTILDVRDRMTYNEGHIMGSMSMPMDELVDRATPSLVKSRDIYVYGANDQETNQAAQALRSAGFEHVSALKGGLAAWKAVGGPTEGIVESMTPAGADDYNVVDRLKNHAETQNKDV